MKFNNGGKKKMTNTYNPFGKDIRFIDSNYKDLFRIPDGGCIQIHFPYETVVKPCTFIDEYHTQIGYNVFHICQFAETMESNGASYMAEPEIVGDNAAWKVGANRFLAIQICEDGYDYALLDGCYNEIDGGRVDTPELSMLEVRRNILESFGLECRDLRAMSYEDVMEQMFEKGRLAVDAPEKREFVMKKLMRAGENDSYIRGYQKALEDINDPMLVILKRWNPSECPRCHRDFSEFEECEDGCYNRATNRDRCPYCGQKLKWEEFE